MIVHHGPREDHHINIYTPHFLATLCLMQHTHNLISLIFCDASPGFL